METRKVEKRHWQERIVIPSAGFWREESVVLAAGEMQIRRSPRDDNSKSVPIFSRTSTEGNLRR